MQTGDKRELIIDAAIRVFSDKGIVKAKVSDVVQEAGVALSGDMHKWESIYEPFYVWMAEWLEEDR